MTIREIDKEPMLSQRKLISKVSQRSKINPDTTRQVLNAFYDVMIAEIANRGKFRMTSILTIETANRKESVTPLGVYPATTYLKARMSKTVKYLFKRKTEYPEAVITPENWRLHLKDIEENGPHGDRRKDN